MNRQGRGHINGVHVFSFFAPDIRYTNNTTKNQTDTEKQSIILEFNGQMDGPRNGQANGYGRCHLSWRTHGTY